MGHTSVLLSHTKRGPCHKAGPLFVSIPASALVGVAGSALVDILVVASHARHLRGLLQVGPGLVHLVAVDAVDLSVAGVVGQAVGVCHDAVLLGEDSRPCSRLGRLRGAVILVTVTERAGNRDGLTPRGRCCTRTSARGGTRGTASSPSPRRLPPVGRVAAGCAPLRPGPGADEAARPRGRRRRGRRTRVFCQVELSKRDCGGNLGPNPSYATRPKSLRYCMGLL